MTTAQLTARTEFLSKFYDAAPMKHTFKLELSFDNAGNAHFVLPYQKEFCHSLLDTHGGVIATMIDNAGWFTAATRYETWVNTSELTVRLHEPANQEELRASGQIVRAGSKICVVSMEVKSASDRLIATGAGTFVVSEKVMKLPEGIS